MNNDKFGPVNRLRRQVLGSTLASMTLGVAALSRPVQGGAVQHDQTRPQSLLNVSYDVSRELFAQINPAFVTEWKARSGQTVEILQSHGGSSKQARSVAEGLQADVVTLNQVTDVSFLQKQGLIESNWQTRFADHACPYFSLPVFLVRAGNPKGIRDWADLARPGIQPVLSNPKTSGNGRYAYLGAYAAALLETHGDDARAQSIVGRTLANVPVFDGGGRGATLSFVDHGIGDVLVTFESEVHSIQQAYPQAGLAIVLPPASVRADFPVALVDRVVDRHGTRALATAYLQFLYAEAAQEILARNFNRVRHAAVAARHAAQFPAVRLLTVEEQFGGWEAVASRHFAEGAILDQLLTKAARQ